MSYFYYPDGSVINFLTSRTLSIQYFPMCCLKHLFYFICLSHWLYFILFLKWLIFIILMALLIFSYFQDLIHSIFSNLLSQTLVFLHWLYFILYLKYLIFIILIALLYIFLLPGTYPFNLLQFVVPVVF